MEDSEKEVKKKLKLKEKEELKSLKKAKKDEKKVQKNIKKTIKDEKKASHKEKMAPIKEEWRKKNEAPERPILEEIGSSVSHGIGALLTIVALILLLQKSNTGLKITASIVYFTAMLFMFLNSCLYHAFKWGTKVKRIWRRFDYTSIYLLVAGTFAPLQLIETPYEYGDIGLIWGITYFAIMWTLVIIGVTFTCIFGPGRVKKINFPLYFIIGWSGICMIPGWIIHERYALIWWIVGGGIVYTLGMIPFGLFRNKKGMHFVWHLIVFAGVILHFLGLYFTVY